MEREDLSQLSNSIEAAQERLAATMSQLRHESKPKVMAAHAVENTGEKAKALVVEPNGAVRLEAIVAGVVAVAAISAVVLFRRGR